MLMLVMMIAGLARQETPYAAAASGEIYAAPVIRPYEPPSDFGRQVAEGDADASVRSRPITAPVAVEAYRHTYERRQSPAELSYALGVEQAREAQNARMGALDGVWRVVGQDGRPVADLVLSDRGSDRPVEGAISLRAGSGGATAVIDTVVRSTDAVEIQASANGHPLSLRLQPTATGWSGVLNGPDGRTAVALTRTS